MARSWCLAIALLVSGGMTAAAAVSSTHGVAPSSHQAGVTQTDGSVRLAMVHCDAKQWAAMECIHHKRFHCNYSEGTNCKVTKTCKLYYPLPQC